MWCGTEKKYMLEKQTFAIGLITAFSCISFALVWTTIGFFISNVRTGMYPATLLNISHCYIQQDDLGDFVYLDGVFDVYDEDEEKLMKTKPKFRDDDLLDYCDTCYCQTHIAEKYYFFVYFRQNQIVSLKYNEKRSRRKSEVKDFYSPVLGYTTLLFTLFSFVLCIIYYYCLTDDKREERRSFVIANKTTYI